MNYQSLYLLVPIDEKSSCHDLFMTTSCPSQVVQVLYHHLLHPLSCQRMDNLTNTSIPNDLIMVNAAVTKIIDISVQRKKEKIV